MTDLHARLRAAITTRQDAAFAAKSLSAAVGRLSVAWVDAAGRLRLPGGGSDVALSPETTAHITANNPSAIIRMCRRDLSVLERHAQVFGSTSDEAWDRNPICDYERHPWPCVEVRDMAEAYGVEVTS